MDKIEKIKAEIERLIGMNKTKNGFPAGTLCAVRIEAYEHLLSFLDTLSEEPDKSLEEAAEEIATDILGKDYLSELDEDCAIDTLNEATNLVKAGAEWQKSQMLKPEVDWDAFRREAAKTAMLGLLAGRRQHPDMEYVCGASVQYADELIKRLKEEKYDTR